MTLLNGSNSFLFRLFPPDPKETEVQGRHEMELTLTPNAASKVRGFLKEFAESPDAGLRVSVLPGGCSGFQYGVDIDEVPEGDDEILERSGIRVFVDPFSAQYLEGLEIDYVTSMMGSGFSFRNPQAAGGCGCGSSFTV